MIFPTVSREVTGTAVLSRIVAALCAESVWFSVTPLADDVYSIEVKLDAKHFLESPSTATAQYYVLYTTSYGPQTIQFDSAEDRDEWAQGLDDDGEDYYAIDTTGGLRDAYILSIGNEE